MPTNTHRNPGNHDDWSFNWLKLPMLLIYNNRITKIFKSLSANIHKVHCYYIHH